MLKTIPVLDHGFIKIHNIAGPTRRATDLNMFDADDTDPANTARMSFGKMNEDRTHEEDLKLAEYLMKSKHTSPFEQIEIWVEMKLPIFVARQWVRHRTASLNEVSGRYIQLPPEWYIPELYHVELQAPSKKQGGKFIDRDNPVEVATAKRFIERLERNCQISYEAYQLSIKDGIAMEHARLELHVNHYTHWIWKQDFHNMMHLLALRENSHAQYEIRQYAHAISNTLRKQLPHSMKLYDKYYRI